MATGHNLHVFIGRSHTKSKLLHTTLFRSELLQQRWWLASLKLNTLVYMVLQDCF